MAYGARNYPCSLLKNLIEQIAMDYVYRNYYLEFLIILVCINEILALCMALLKLYKRISTQNVAAFGILLLNKSRNLVK